jgi:hypothetical protein
MAVHKLPDIDSLAVRVIELEDQEAEIERRLVKLMDRHSQYPNEVTERQIADLQKQHLETRRELNTVRAQLVPIMRTPFSPHVAEPDNAPSEGFSIAVSPRVSGPRFSAPKFPADADS